MANKYHNAPFRDDTAARKAGVAGVKKVISNNASVDKAIKDLKAAGIDAKPKRR